MIGWDMELSRELSNDPKTVFTAWIQGGDRDHDNLLSFSLGRFDNHFHKDMLLEALHILKQHCTVCVSYRLSAMSQMAPLVTWYYLVIKLQT